MPRKKERTW